MRGVVLFDFGGTLDADGERWSVRFHRAYRAAGGRLGFARFEDAFRESDRVLAGLPDIRGMGLRPMIEAQAGVLLPLLGERPPRDPAPIVDAFHAELVATVRRNRPLLEGLADRYRLAVVSNFSGNLDHCLADLELVPLFTVAVDSGRVGIEKPDPRIFAIALDALGAPAESAWMVGDSFEADIRPAAALGLATCWVAPPERPLPAPGIATARVGRLTDLTRVLD